MRSEERKLRVEAAAHNAGLSSSGLINALLDWWMGEPGAELPERPKETSVTITTESIRTGVRDTPLIRELAPDQGQR